MGEAMSKNEKTLSTADLEKSKDEILKKISEKVKAGDTAKEFAASHSSHSSSSKHSSSTTH
jgi:hypothetical protein